MKQFGYRMLSKKKKSETAPIIYVGGISLLEQFVLKCHSNETGLNRKVVKSEAGQRRKVSDEGEDTVGSNDKT